MNRYLAINIEGKIGQPTVIRTSSFNNNNNKKRCKNNKSPNFVWGLNYKKRSKHNVSKTSFGGHNKRLYNQPCL